MPQQATINLPAHSPVRALQGLARQIALPSEYAPERFPSFPALERTALMAFTQPATLPLRSSTATKVMVTRQASWPVWAEQQTGASGNSIAYQVVYKFQPYQSNAAEATNEAFNPTIVGWSVGNQVASTTMVGVANARSPFLYPPLGVDAACGPLPFVYVPNGSVFNLVVSIPAVNAANIIAEISYEFWTSPGELITANTSANQWLQTTITAGQLSANAAITTLSAGWVRVSKVTFNRATVGLVAGPCQVNVVVQCGGSGNSFNQGGGTTIGSFLGGGTNTTYGFFPLVMSSEFANSTLPWYATRTTAAAMLGTNVTQILSKGGTILGGRISPNVMNPWIVTESYISGLHPAEKAWLPLETGVYTYCPPSTDLANFWDYTLNTAGGASPCPIYRLDNDSMVNMMFLTAGSTDESLAVTASWHIEFRTSSALFQVALSGMQLETLHQAQLALAMAGFFFENPVHSKILQAVIGAAKRLAPLAVPIASAINPTAGRVVSAALHGYSAYRAAKAIVPPRAKMVVPTTTAKSSGMNGVVVKKKPVRVAKRK